MHIGNVFCSLCASLLLEFWEGILSCCGLVLSYRFFKDYIADTADCKTVYLGTNSSHALKVECAENMCVCMYEIMHEV